MENYQKTDLQYGVEIERDNMWFMSVVLSRYIKVWEISIDCEQARPLACRSPHCLVYDKMLSYDCDMYYQLKSLWEYLLDCISIELISGHHQIIRKSLWYLPSMLLQSSQSTISSFVWNSHFYDAPSTANYQTLVAWLVSRAQIWFV